MFDRFTDEARHAAARSQEAARRLGSARAGSGHIFLGVLEEEIAVISNVLGECGASPTELHTHVYSLLPCATGEQAQQPIPFDEDGREVWRLSFREALQLGHAHFGPEHILLGLIRADASTSAQALQDHGLQLTRVRRSIVRLAPRAGGLGREMGERAKVETLEHHRRVMDSFSDTIRRIEEAGDAAGSG